MDCKKVEKKIPAFLNNEMDIYMLKSFLGHIDNCPECREELTIQFLVTEGINVLETGDSYDIKEALENRLAKAHHEIRVNKRLFWVRNIVFAVSIILFFVFVYFIYMFM